MWGRQKSCEWDAEAAPSSLLFQQKQKVQLYFAQISPCSSIPAFFLQKSKNQFCSHFWETRAFFLMPSDWSIVCSTLFLTRSYPLSFRLLRLCHDLNHLLIDSNQIKILGFYFWDFLSWHSKKRNARWGGSSKIAILKVLYLLKQSWSSDSLYFKYHFHRLFKITLKRQWQVFLMLYWFSIFFSILI